MDDKISLFQGISMSGNIIVQIGAGFRVEGEPSVLSQTDVTQSTPLQQFLKCRNLLEAGQDVMPSLHGLLDIGMKSEDLDILLILDNNQEIDLTNRNENTGLLPYMSAAALSTCGLDSVYTLAMYINLGMIP